MHTTPTLHAKRNSSVYISFSSDITAKSEDNFNQKQKRHFFKARPKLVAIGIRALSQSLGDDDDDDDNNNS